MGDWYELKELTGTWYIEYQSDATAWTPVAVQLTQEQAKEAEEFENAQSEKKRDFLKGMIAKAKA